MPSPRPVNPSFSVVVAFTDMQGRLLEVNESYCTMSGYGQTGPLAPLAGHDLNIAGMSGLLQRSEDELLPAYLAVVNTALAPDKIALVVPFIPMADGIGNGAAAWPVWTALNLDAPLWLSHVAFVVTVGSRINLPAATSTIAWHRPWALISLSGYKAMPGVKTLMSGRTQPADQ